MLRKLNFTERAKVPKSQVRVTLQRGSDGVLSFDPHVSLDGVGAPANARVFIEVYHRTSFMRFDCGSVGEFTPPADRRLIDIDGTSVRFRVKVVDGHRIVAVADDVRVTEHAPETAGRTPLLPVQFTAALDQQVWRVVFEPDTPVLELNNRVDGIDRIAREPFFFALVYPAAIRMILTQILLVERHDAFEESAEWWSLWIRWAQRQTSISIPADFEDAARWIDEVVSAFTSQYRLVDRIREEKPES